MAHALSRWLVVAVATMAVVVALLMQPHGRSDSGRSAADRERDGEIEDLGTVTVSLGGGVTMEFVLIPAGTFLMGSPKEEKEREDDEGPQHEVRITRSFYLGKYEVTQEQYKQIVGKNPSCFSANGDNKQFVAGLDTWRFPVENVFWDDATAFCRKLSERDRKWRRFRLPTEAEWEYACRAGTTTPFHFGSSLNGDKANCDGTNPYGTEKKGANLQRPCRVGSYAANAFGLHDMHGNVCEWCADWYEKEYHNKSDKKDPKGPQNGDTRVLRGGSWNGGAWRCRAAVRRLMAPSICGSDMGFRVAFRLD